MCKVASKALTGENFPPIGRRLRLRVGGDYHLSKCPGGGIGRRAGFRCQWLNGREGSSPFLGTILGFDDKSPKQINYIIRKPLAEQGLCATALCHQRVRKASAKLYPARRRAESTCATRLCHQSDASRSLEQFERLPSRKAGQNLSEGVEPNDGVGSRVYQNDQHRPFPDADMEHFHGAGQRCTKVAPKQSGLIVRGRSMFDGKCLSIHAYATKSISMKSATSGIQRVWTKSTCAGWTL